MAMVDTTTDGGVRTLLKRMGKIAFVAVTATLLACGGGGGGGSGSGSGGTTGAIAPIIAVQPQPQTVADGQSVTFSVGATGTAPLAYQWSRGGVAITGATASTYTITAVQLADSGAAFAATVTNAAGSATTTAATLTVQAVAPSIANNTAQTVSVIAGATATFRVAASGSAPLTFQWRRGGVAIAGATGTTYTTPATTLADNGATFDVVVANAAGTATSATFTLVVTAAPTPAVVTTQPQSLVVRAGNPATFTVVAGGTAPFTYQWLRNGAAIAGAQASSYTLTTTQTSDSGAQFSVTVSNAAGSATSASATLTVVSQGTSALYSGNVGGPGTIDGNGSAARFAMPTGVAVDAGGNAFVADVRVVRKLAPDGTVTTIAGSPLASGSTDGNGSAALFGNVSAVAVTSTGTIYAADSSNQTIRAITAAGAVTTYAGSTNVVGASDGTGGAARFNAPAGIAVDGAGNVYVADTGNQTIRKISAGGVVTTLAGTAGTAGAADGSGTAATFNMPTGIAVDASGNVYVADRGDSTIRMITPSGVVTTIAGAAGQTGSTDGTGAAARFNGPTGITVDGSGNLYVGDGLNGTIRRIAAGGVVTTIAGAAGRTGSADGTGALASFSVYTAVAVDGSGRLFVADRDNSTVRSVSTTAVVTTVAGLAAVAGSADGSGTVATFRQPYGLALSATGAVYVTDTGNSTIRVIDSSGSVTTLAGSPGLSGTADGQGGTARFGSLRGIAVNAAGTIYVSDFGNNTIRQITPSGAVTTLAGRAGVAGAADGNGTAATFNGPTDLAIDGAGNLFVTDTANNVVRRVTPAGVVSTFAGTAGRLGSADGTGAAASFNLPRGITVDASNNLYVSDGGNGIVRKITPTAIVTTIAGTAGRTGSADGPGAAASFFTLNGISIDGGGNLYVVDTGNRTVRKIDPSGNVTTVVGMANGLRGVRTGGLPGGLDQPLEVAATANGGLYLTDSNGVLVITAP